MCYDISQSHRFDIEANRSKMKEIEKRLPETYFIDREWRRLAEENRQHEFVVRDYENKIKQGVKF